MVNLCLTIALWGCSIFAPLGGSAEPVAASLRAAPVLQTYHVVEIVRYPPPIREERGLLVTYGDCTSPCPGRRWMEDSWGLGNWHWRCFNRRGGWQICGAQ
jgi:hypothetical protein